MTSLERETSGPTTFQQLVAQPGPLEHLVDVDASDSDVQGPPFPTYRFVPANWPAPSILLADVVATPAERTDAAVAGYERAVADLDAYPGRVDSSEERAAVDAAGTVLEDAVRDELLFDPVHPPSVPRSGEEIRQAAERIAARYPGSPDAVGVMRESAEVLAVDAEVAETLRTVDAADTPEEALSILNDALATTSPAAAERLLGEVAVVQLLDGIADYAVEPLDDMDDRTSTLEQRVGGVLSYLNEQLPDGSDPELVVALLERVQPALDEAIEENARRSRDEAGFDLDEEGAVPLIDADRFGILARLSGLASGSEHGQATIEGLARLADQGNRLHLHDNIRSAEGRGTTLAIELARLIEADPNRGDGAAVLEAALDAFDTFLTDSEGPVATSLAAYAEHTAELTFIVANFPPGLTPFRREAAIAEYLDGRDAAWHTELARLERDIAVHGADALMMREQLANLPPDLAHRSATTDARLAEIVAGDNFVLATSTAANGHLDLLSRVDLDEAIDFFNVTGTANGTLGLAETFANARFRGTVTDALGELDPLNMASVRNARQRIEELRTPAIAQAWGIEPAELDLALDALLETLPDTGGRFVSREVTRRSLEELDTTLEGIDRFRSGTPLGIAVRSFAAASGIVSTYGSVRSFAEDPSVEAGSRAFLDAAGLGGGTVDLFEGVGALGDDSALVTRFGANSPVRKLLGRAGTALAVLDTVREFRDGDLVQGGAGVVGLVGVAIGGPWGLALALGSAVFSIGLDQYRKVEASNDFAGDEGDAARAALRHAGLSESSAAALVDRSGEGHSAVPLVMRYGELHGLTPLQTIGWINSLSDEELASVRDHFHHFLDDNDGDPEAFEWTSDGDGAVQRELDGTGRPRRYSLIDLDDATSVVSADLIFADLGIDVPTPPDDPYARPRIG